MLADLACILLSNLTKSITAARHLLQVDEPKLTGLFLLQLVEIFCRGRHFNPEADFHFLASVFANVTAVCAVMLGRLPGRLWCVLTGSSYHYDHYHDHHGS